jgi:hypothetical protein
MGSIYIVEEGERVDRSNEGGGFREPLQYGYIWSWRAVTNMRAGREVVRCLMAQSWLSCFAVNGRCNRGILHLTSSPVRPQIVLLICSVDMMAGDGYNPITN